MALRPRMIVLAVVVLLVVVTVVGVIAARLSRSAESATPPRAAEELTSDSRVGPWSITLSDYTTIGPADHPDRYVVTVNAHNVTSGFADLSALRFFAAIRDANSAVFIPTGPNTIDCAPEDGSPLPRTGLVDPDATRTGRVCLKTVGTVGTDVPTWVQISAYVADPKLLAANISLGHPHTGDKDRLPWFSWTITDIRADGPDTHVTSALVATPTGRYRNWLLAASALDSENTPDPGNVSATQECRPGTGFAPVPSIAVATPQPVEVTSELCVHFTVNWYRAGFLPRMFWDFPRPTRTR
ncbi:hypothetical protein ABZ942_18830 [Nocardia sp. NPDC046473]|uniref:hypothetical protein n=1 Tax=Nocardia sp. NPDC046473 TaxID=3155733 RepID=UPI0033C899F6